MIELDKLRFERSHIKNQESDIRDPKTSPGSEAVTLAEGTTIKHMKEQR